MVGATISGTIGSITEKARAESVISRALWGLFLLFVGGLTLLLLISNGVALMTAAAMFLGGVGLGFLFGLPRAGRATTASGEAARRNTNLEEVSDWLTKILVGVGLVEMGSLVEWLGPQLHHLGKGLGGTVRGGRGAGPRDHRLQLDDRLPAGLPVDPVLVDPGAAGGPGGPPSGGTGRRQPRPHLRPAIPRGG